jgi:hypothetical protein
MSTYTFKNGKNTVKLDMSKAGNLWLTHTLPSLPFVESMFDAMRKVSKQHAENVETLESLMTIREETRKDYCIRIPVQRVDVGARLAFALEWQANQIESDNRREANTLRRSASKIRFWLKNVTKSKPLPPEPKKSLRMRFAVPEQTQAT